VLETLDDAAASTRGEVFRNGQKIGAVDLLFSHVDQSAADLELPEHNFVFGDTFRDLLRTYRLHPRTRG
jgi:hypothetical protein